jgi:hypothetical protein
MDFVLLYPRKNLLHLWKSTELLSKETIPGIFPNFEAWHFILSSPDSSQQEIIVKVCLRHCSFTGLWLLIINGIVKAVSTVEIFDNLQITFKIYKKVLYLKGRGLFSFQNYRLSNEQFTLNEKKYTNNLIADVDIIPSKVNIFSTNFDTINGKTVVFYQITVIPRNGEIILIERRFSEFVTLNYILRSLTKVTDKNVLPELPSKSNYMFEDQTKISFVEHRRSGLEKYIQAIIRNPNVRFLIYFLFYQTLFIIIFIIFYNKKTK